MTNPNEATISSVITTLATMVPTQGRTVKLNTEFCFCFYGSTTMNHI